MARRGRSGRSDSAIFTAEGAEKNPFFCFIAPRLCVSAVRLLSRGPAQNLFAFTQLCYFAPPQQARSSVVEHHLDMVVVGGSIPLAPTRVNEIARKRARLAPFSPCGRRGGDE